MSQANIESMRRSYDAMSKLDAEALAAVCDPDVEFQSRIMQADNVTYRGHDGVREYIAGLAEVFEWLRPEELDLIEEDDRAVVCARMRARGRASGVEVEESFFQALRFRDGKALWWAFYPTKAEAMEAVGLQD
jgi:ketosteroid isomerase-like protein